MDEELDIQLRYVGRRFEGAKLPLEILVDLPAFRDLLVAYAKQLWKDKHADRQRVPKGFEQSLNFDLVQIREGSAIPKLSWDRDSAQHLLPGFANELHGVVTGAFNEVVALVAKAANDEFPKALSPEHVRALNRFGSALRDDERIEFLNTDDGHGNVIYLDSARRKSIITKVRETYLSRYEGVGTLVGIYAPVDGEGRPSIRVHTADYGEIELRVDVDRVQTEFDGWNGSPVQFEVELELDNADRFRGVVEVHSVGLVDDQIAVDLARLNARLDELSELADNWDGEGAIAISGDAVATARAFLGKRAGFSGLYRIFPNGEGGVLFEFVVDGWDLSVDIGSDGSLELFGIEVEGKGELAPTRFDGVSAAFIEAFDRVSTRTWQTN